MTNCFTYDTGVDRILFVNESHAWLLLILDHSLHVSNSGKSEDNPFKVTFSPSKIETHFPKPNGKTHKGTFQTHRDLYYCTLSRRFPKKESFLSLCCSFRQRNGSDEICSKYQDSFSTFGKHIFPSNILPLEKGWTNVSLPGDKNA